MSSHARDFRGIARKCRLFWSLENCRIGVGDASGLRVAGTQNFCEPPVHHQDFAKWTDHDSRGLQVAVKNAARMSECNRIANAKEQTQAVRNRSNRLDVLVEALAFEDR